MKRPMTRMIILALLLTGCAGNLTCFWVFWNWWFGMGAVSLRHASTRYYLEPTPHSIVTPAKAGAHPAISRWAPGQARGDIQWVGNYCVSPDCQNKKAAPKGGLLNLKLNHA